MKEDVIIPMEDYTDVELQDSDDCVHIVQGNDTLIVSYADLPKLVSELNKLISD